MSRVSQVAAPAKARTARASKGATQEILDSLDVRLPQAEAPLGYRVAMVLLVVYLALITVAYLGLVAFLAWVLIWNSTKAVTTFGSGPYFLYYVPMALLGGLLLLFIVKPVFFRRKSREDAILTLTRDEQPVLFEFVERLCAATGATPPAVIEVDCEANAGARRAGGLLGAFQKELVLRFGLPLAASMTVKQFAGVLAHEFGHFNQHGGMTASYLVRRMSATFGRIVFDRDRIDERLAGYRFHKDGATRLFFRVVSWMVEAARGVLWVMFVTAELLSCGFLRRMEYDADRVEAQLVGCREFLTTNRLMTFLAIAARRAHSDLADAWEQRRLADDLPRLIVAHAKQLAEYRDGILKVLDEEKTQWFDTHPCHSDRVASVRATGAEGLLHCDVAAKHLFKNFAGLSHDASKARYRAIVGDALDSCKLIPTAELVEQRSGERESFSALRRFFRAGAVATRPILPADGADRPARPGEDRVLAKELAAAREEMVSLADPDVAAEYTTSHSEVVLGHAKVKFATLFGTGRAHKLHKEGQAELQTHEPLRLHAVNRLIPFEKAARRRLTAALRLAQTPPWADDGADSKAGGAPSTRTVARLTRVCHALQPHVEKVEQLRELCLYLRVHYGAYNPQQPYPPLVRRILTANADAIRLLDELKSDLKAIPYPFAHAKEGISVGEALISTKPDPQDPGAVHGVSTTAIEQFYDVLYRALAELTQHAERIERGLGLEALPDVPGPTKKMEQEEADRVARERAAVRRNTRKYWVGHSIRAAAGIALLTLLVVLSVSPPAFAPADNRVHGSSLPMDPASPYYRSRPIIIPPSQPRTSEPPAIGRDLFDPNPYAPRANPRPNPYGGPSSPYRASPYRSSPGGGLPSSPGRR